MFEDEKIVCYKSTCRGVSLRRPRESLYFSLKYFFSWGQNIVATTHYDVKHMIMRCREPMLLPFVPKIKNASLDI